MSAYTPPVTRENLPQVFQYSKRKYYWAKKKSIIRSAAITVGQVLFFCSFLVLAYGIVYDLSSGLMRSFLDKVPSIAHAWQQLSAILLPADAGLARQLLNLFLFLYGIPTVAALIPAAIIILCYHPKTPRMSQDPREQSKDLQNLSQSVFHCLEKKKNSVFSFCALFFGLIIVGFFICFAFYFKNDPTLQAQLQSHFAQTCLYMILAWAGVFLAYWLLNLPLRGILSLLYHCHIPKTYYQDMDAFYRSQRVSAGVKVPASTVKEASPQESVPAAEEEAADSIEDAK